VSYSVKELTKSMAITMTYGFVARRMVMMAAVVEPVGLYANWFEKDKVGAGLRMAGCVPVLPDYKFLQHACQNWSNGYWTVSRMLIRCRDFGNGSNSGHFPLKWYD